MSGLVVLEGRWQNNRNTSVRSLFDLLMDMEFGSSHEYYFENFATSETLRSIISHVCGQHSRKKYIYIGAHGDEGQIYGSVDRITRASLNNTLRDFLGGQIRGVFFGSCLFCNEDNAEFFFHNTHGVPNNVKWIAGYGRSVDWMESSALDILFWLNLFREKNRNPQSSEINIIDDVCNNLNGMMGGLMRELEFQVFRRWPGRPSEPQALIDWK